MVSRTVLKTTGVWTAGSTSAHCCLGRPSVRPSVGPSTDDDVRNSVFVYGLTALNSVAVSWPYCKWTRAVRGGMARPARRRAWDRLRDRNARTHARTYLLLLLLLLAPVCCWWRRYAGRKQLIDANSSVRHLWRHGTWEARQKLVLRPTTDQSVVSETGHSRSAQYRASVMICVKIFVIMSQTAQHLASIWRLRDSILCWAVESSKRQALQSLLGYWRWRGYWWITRFIWW